MSQVIILSDIQEHDRMEHPASPRSIAPYILAKKARDGGFSATVIDHFTKLDNFWELFEQAVTEETIFIGFSSTFLSVETKREYNRRSGTMVYTDGFLWLHSDKKLREFLENIREIISLRSGRKIPLAIGGAKAIYSIQSSVLRPMFDCYFIGKAESFFVEYLTLLKNGAHIPYSTYEGAKFIHEKAFNKSTTDIQANIFDVQDIVDRREALPIEIAKGCMYNCKFCNFEKQGAMRRPTETFKNELLRNYEHFGTTYYAFVDDCFNDTRGKVEEICGAIMSLPFKIEWAAYSRVDVAVRFPETLDLMMASGARGLFWGLESFDHEVARRAGKGTDPVKIKEMLIGAREKYGDQCIMLGSFIIGLPGETEESLQSTLDWILSTKVFHIVYYGALAILAYSERLDKAVVDFADYSRNPQKYGFEELRQVPDPYWRHSTMDLNRAKELRLIWRDALKRGRNGRVPVLTSTWQYPHIRALGFSHADVVQLVNQGTWGDAQHQLLIERQAEYYRKYARDLAKHLQTNKKLDFQHINYK